MAVPGGHWGKGGAPVSQVVSLSEYPDDGTGVALALRVAGRGLQLYSKKGSLASNYHPSRRYYQYEVPT